MTKKNDESNQYTNNQLLYTAAKDGSQKKFGYSYYGIDDLIEIFVVCVKKGSVSFSRERKKERKLR